MTNDEMEEAWRYFLRAQREHGRFGASCLHGGDMPWASVEHAAEAITRTALGECLPLEKVLSLGERLG